MACTIVLAYGDVLDQLKMYCGKIFVEKFGEHIEDELKRLYSTFRQQSMTELTDVLKREHEAAEQCHICFKEFNEPENKKLRDRCYHMGFYWGAFHNKGNLKYRILDHILIVFHNLSGYDARLFIKELGKKFNKDDIGVIADSKEKYVIFNVKISIKLAGVTNKDSKEVCKNIQLE